MDKEQLDELSELDAIFADIGGNEKLEENANTGFDEIEDGVYNAEIINAEFTKSKADVPMIKIEFGLEGVNGHVWDYLMLANKDGDYKKTASAMSRTVTKLKQLGLVAEDIKGYVSQLPSLEGHRLTLTLDTSKSGFQNKSYSDAQ